MRNLRNIRHEQWKAPAEFNGRPLTAATWDLANDTVLCTFGPSEENALIELVRVKTKSHSQYVTLQTLNSFTDFNLGNIQLLHHGMHLAQILTFCAMRF